MTEEDIQFHRNKLEQEMILRERWRRQREDPFYNEMMEIKEDLERFRNREKIVISWIKMRLKMKPNYEKLLKIKADILQLKQEREDLYWRLQRLDKKIAMDEIQDQRNWKR